MIRRPLVALALSGAVLAGCGGGQDPGVPESPDGGPTTTSHLLSACPTDTAATIPPEGCLDEDGRVVSP